MAKAEKPDGRRANGRPTGSINKLTAETYARAKKSGVLPVDFMLKQMRNGKNSLEVRMQAARDAAPYIHGKIQAIALSGSVGLSHEQALKALADE